MKRIILLLSVVALLFSLSACSTDGEASSVSFTDYSGQTLTGRIVAVDGTLVALQLGEASDDAGMMMAPGSSSFDVMPTTDSNEENTDTSSGEEEGLIDSDSSDTETTDAQDTTSDQATEQSEATETMDPPSDLPSGEGDAPEDLPSEDGEMPQDLPDGQTDGDRMQMPGGQGMGLSGGFLSSGETAILNVDGASIVIESDSEEEEGSTDDLIVGAMVTIEVDEQNAVSTITINSTSTDSFGASEASES